MNKSKEKQVDVAKKESTENAKEPSEIQDKNEGMSKSRKVYRMMCDKRMFCFCLVHVFYELAYYVPMVFLPEMMATHDGISKEKAGTIFSTLG